MDAVSAVAVEDLSPVARARAKITELRGWRRALLAFAAGGFSALAFAPMFVTPVLFLTLPVFVWLVDGSSDRRRRSIQILISI